MSEQAPKRFKTREEGLQHLIQIATAFLKKKPVQIFNTHNNRWDDCYGWHDLSAEPHIFRIKPEPREWWEIRHLGGNDAFTRHSFASRENAVIYAEKSFDASQDWKTIVEIIKVREVIE